MQPDLTMEIFNLAREIEKNCRDEAEAAATRTYEAVQRELKEAEKDRVLYEATATERWKLTIRALVAIGLVAVFGLGVAVGLGVLAITDVVAFIK